MKAINAIFLVILLVIIFIFVVDLNSRKRDERQEAIVDRGMKYAFIAVMFLNLVVYLSGIFQEKSALASENLAALSIWVGTLVCTTYTIWQHAYFPVKAKKTTSTGWFYLGIGGVELLYVGATHLNGRIVLPQDIYLLFLGILAVVVGGTILLRNYVDHKKDDKL